MICPCCHKLKEKDDFYWRGQWLVHKECKECQAKIRKVKSQELKKTIEGIFDVNLHYKLMCFENIRPTTAGIKRKA